MKGRGKRKILIFSIIFVGISLIIVLVNFIRHQYVVPIVMYHSVNPDAVPEKRREVSVGALERQMHFLKSHHYNVLSLENVVTLMKNKKKIPAKTIAITFDDGYKDNYIYAFPILKKYNLPATIFIIVNEVGRPDRLSWQDIKIMQDSGLVVFGSHAVGPDPLVKIESEGELKMQIFDSKKILEEKLDRTVNAFSYPEGRFNAKIRQLIMDAGYKLAVATNPGKNFPNDDNFALKRLRISSTSNNLLIFWIETSGYYNFIREHRHK